ncbi:MAG: hypothetical protein PHH16_05245 [Candidatus Gracilibacteria bacterium]|nr:hypothetical protein [Candidatus Gracilibacteria bacterium]
MLKVSPFFAHLYDLYLEQLQLLSRDSQGEESSKVRQQSLSKHREEASEYLSIMKTDPEFAAPLFYDLFDFQIGTMNKDVIEIVGSKKSGLPKFSRIINELAFKGNIRPQLFDMVLGIDGGDKFLVTVIGLEYLRFIDWTPESMEVPILEPDDPDDEEGWLRNEAPEILGLDPLSTCNE